MNDSVRQGPGQGVSEVRADESWARGGDAAEGWAKGSRDADPVGAVAHRPCGGPTGHRPGPSARSNVCGRARGGGSATPIAARGEVLFRRAQLSKLARRRCTGFSQWCARMHFAAPRASRVCAWAGEMQIESGVRRARLGADCVGFFGLPLCQGYNRWLLAHWLKIERGCFSQEEPGAR